MLSQPSLGSCRAGPASLPTLSLRYSHSHCFDSHTSPQPTVLAFGAALVVVCATRSVTAAYDRNLVCSGHPDEATCLKDRGNRCFWWNKSCVGGDAYEVGLTCEASWGVRAASFRLAAGPWWHLGKDVRRHYMSYKYSR